MAGNRDKCGKGKSRSAESSSSRKRSKRSRSQYNSMDKAISMELVCIKDEIVCIPSKLKRDEKNGRRRSESGKRSNSKRDLEADSCVHLDNSDSALSENDRYNSKARKIQQLSRHSREKRRKHEMEEQHSCSCCCSSDGTDRESRSRDKERRRRQDETKGNPKGRPKSTRKCKREESQHSMASHTSKLSGNSSSDEVIFLKVYMPRDCDGKCISLANGSQSSRKPTRSRCYSRKRPEKNTKSKSEMTIPPCACEIVENQCEGEQSSNDEYKHKPDKTKKKKSGIFNCLKKSKKEK